MKPSDILSIGYLSERTGLSVSAIRFYEEKGLITPHRNSGGHRRYMRSDIRRLSFVMIAQKLGFTIEQIVEKMRRLPEGRTPTARDWEKISNEFMMVLEDRIEALSRMKNSLEGCIGCGCLSLEKCKLYNPDDEMASIGPGPQNAIRTSKEET